MAARRTPLGILLAPVRWLLEEVGSTLFALAVFASVVVLTGLAHGNPWEAALYLSPLVATVVWLALRRRERA